MKDVKTLRLLLMLTGILLVAAALAGLLGQGAGPAKSAFAIDGREIDLFGRGAYANHSLLRATSYIGADWAMLLIVAPMLLITAVCLGRYRKSLLVCSGALMIVFYYAISLTFGAAFNHYFLLYTALFAVSGFTFGFSVYRSGKTAWKQDKRPQGSSRGTAIFLFLAGSSALVWLSMIIPAQITGDFSAFIDINTTEPTFALDIGIVFPLFVVCGIALLKQKEFGYRFTPILLTFYALVGGLVVVQTIVQHGYGIEIPLPQLLSLVVSFIILAVMALVINVRFVRRNVKALKGHET